MTDTPAAGPAGDATCPDRSQNEFWSVDSAPKDFASAIPIWRAPAVCVAFLFIAYGALYAINQAPLLNAAFPDDDLIFAPYTGAHSIPVRIFILSFTASFCLFCNAGARSKALLFTSITLTFALYCALFDVLSIVLNRMFDVTYNLTFIEIISGLLGFWVFSLKLLKLGRMPAKIDSPYKPQRTFQTMARLVIGVVTAAVVSFYVGSLDLGVVHQMRALALLGGIGPGIFLFFPVLFLVWFIIATVDRARMDVHDFSPPVTIVVPAHNEEYIIANTIEAIDKAAEHYDGAVTIFIMNNNSEDATRPIAEAALAKCRAATGNVIDETKPGKSAALNAGFFAVKTDYVVRVDADTLIATDALTRAMRYFHDPNVGVVGGLPIPPGGAMFDRARFLEVIVKHGYYSVALGAINGVVGVPGMLALYRTELPKQLGGFVEGMNGEDTDMSLRIGEMGYQVVVDPKIRYISEVPASYKHMREQRMRWFRSVYHISSRNADYLDRSWLTIRGKVILPYMLINSARRAMMPALVAFGAIEYLTSFNSANTLEWQAVLAVLVGAPALMAVFATLVNGYPRGLLALPDYLVFRAIRAYLTLESLLSIRLTFGEDQAPAKPKRRRSFLAGAAAAFVSVFAASADEARTTITLESGVVRKNIIAEEGAQQPDVRAMLSTGTYGAVRARHHVLRRPTWGARVEGTAGLESFVDQHDLNSTYAAGRAAIFNRNTTACSCRYSATVETMWKARGGDPLFQRNRPDALSIRIDKVRLGRCTIAHLPNCRPRRPLTGSNHCRYEIALAVGVRSGGDGHAGGLNATTGGVELHTILSQGRAACIVMHGIDDVAARVVVVCISAR